MTPRARTAVGPGTVDRSPTSTNDFKVLTIGEDVEVELARGRLPGEVREQVDIGYNRIAILITAQKCRYSRVLSLLAQCYKEACRGDGVVVVVTNSRELLATAHTSGLDKVMRFVTSMAELAPSSESDSGLRQV
jgi:hypothetical protein